MADADASEDEVFGRSIASRKDVIAAQIEESARLRRGLDGLFAESDIRDREDLRRQADVAGAEIEAMTAGLLSPEGRDVSGRALDRLAFALGSAAIVDAAAAIQRATR